MKLTKSLTDLDKAADELLAKSKAAEDNQEDKTEDVVPEEISDDSTASVSEDAEENTADAEKEEKDDEEVKKSCDDQDIKKSEDEGDEPAAEEMEKSEDAPEGDEPEEKSGEDIEKSLKDDFEAEDTIKKSMDNSEFASAMVEVLVKSLGDIQYDAQSASKERTAAEEVLAKSLQAVLATNQTLQADNDRLTRRINKLEKSVSQGFEQVMDSLDSISAQPAHMRKSMASVSVQDRDFDRSVNGVKTVGGFESLNKSQVMGILNNELFAGNQNVTASDIISYESGAPLRPDLQSLVASKCK